MDSVHPPQRIASKYGLVRLLRQGGMGTVYEARNDQTDGRCVVKLLRPELAQSNVYRTRFLREARAAAALQSDHIVKIFDCGLDLASGYAYLVMEYLDGEDLEATRTRLGSFQINAALKLTLQASMGLAKAHEAGIVHRDVKPANLFVTRNDAGDVVLKILDFGVAKIRADRFTEVAGITQGDALLGTPLYMSPEQCGGADKIDCQSDVWSLGVVLWELLAGSTPYKSVRALGSLMASIMSEELPHIQDAAPWVPAQVAAVVHRAMCRDRAKRFKDAAHLRDALLELIPDGATLPAAELVSLASSERHRVATRFDLGARSARFHGGIPTRGVAAIVLGAAVVGAAMAVHWVNETAPAGQPRAPAIAGNTAPSNAIVTPGAATTIQIDVTKAGATATPNAASEFASAAKGRFADKPDRAAVRKAPNSAEPARDAAPAEAVRGPRVPEGIRDDLDDFVENQKPPLGSN